HAKDCPQRGQRPIPVAIYTKRPAEILRLILPVPSASEGESYDALCYSLGYALLTGMRHLYMLSGPEVYFEKEGPWAIDVDGRKLNYVTLAFIDTSLGGTGYL